tara:strand:- start:253 stop:1080 length:828 start_codon:yes stop_codon:yes gene_type:complete
MSECKTRRKSAKYQVGTSGYVVGRGKWEKLACLNCLELNCTFYRLPSQRLINSLDRLPPNVNLIIKASQHITHSLRLNNAEDAWNVLWGKIKDLNALKCVLFQLPPNFNNTDINRQRILDMADYLPQNIDIAFEFRNKSWLVEDTYTMFEKLGWGIVGTVVIKREGTRWVGNMPSGIYMPPPTTNFNYIRIHGKKRWRGKLAAKQLSEIHKIVSSQKVKTSYVIFNNSFFDSRSDKCLVNELEIKSAGVCDAVEFANRVTRRRLGRRLRIKTSSS